MYVHVLAHVSLSAGAQGGLKVLNTLKLELSAVVTHLIWVLGTEFGSFGKIQVLLTTKLSLQSQH